MVKKHRIMAGALGFLLCAGLLCGCSDSGSEESPTPDTSATDNASVNTETNDNSSINDDTNTDQTTPEHEHTYENGVCADCGARRPSEGLVYEWADEEQTEYVLVGIGQCTDTEIMVPSTHNGIPVGAIRISDDNTNTTVTSVYISEGIYGIDCMTGLKNLEYIYVPESVTAIGDMTALEHLEQVDGCEGLEIIKEGFMDCISLKSIQLPDNMLELGNAFVRCNSLTSFRFPAGVEYISSGLLSECENLTEVIIPDSVTSIPSLTFSKCPNLTSITIPASVTTLGRDVFYKSGLKDIYCEAPSQPSGWDPNWAAECGATIHWGSSGNT